MVRPAPSHGSGPKFTFLWESWPHLKLRDGGGRGGWLGEEKTMTF